MITQRPTIGSFRSSGMIGSPRQSHGGVGRGSRDALDCARSHLPHDPLEIGRRDGQLEDPLARRPVEAGVALEQLDVEPDRVARARGRAGRTGRPARGSCRSRPATVSPLTDGSPRLVEVGDAAGAAAGSITTISQSAGSTKPMRRRSASASRSARRAALGVDPDQEPLGVEAEPDRVGARPWRPGSSSRDRCRRRTARRRSTRSTSRGRRP